MIQIWRMHQQLPIHSPPHTHTGCLLSFFQLVKKLKRRWGLKFADICCAILVPIAG
jgi:hypothetical protein